MTKYSSELKVQIASDYLYGGDSYNGLSQKYNIAASIIRTWVKAAELNGLELIFNLFLLTIAVFQSQFTAKSFQAIDFSQV
ncbi:MAG: transposase, partial [Lactobacillus delbrueckii]